MQQAHIIIDTVPEAALALQLMPSRSYNNGLFEEDVLPTVTASELEVLGMVDEGVLDPGAAFAAPGFQVCMNPSASVECSTIDCTASCAGLP